MFLQSFLITVVDTFNVASYVVYIDFTDVTICPFRNLFVIIVFLFKFYLNSFIVKHLMTTKKEII